jgi:hypothetical protein
MLDSTGPERAAESLLEAMEARSRQAETFAWAVPALALTAQAFILTVAFDENVPWGGRSIAAFSGMVILIAALLLLGKHTLNFDFYEAVIDRERAKLGLPPASRNALLGMRRGEPATVARPQVDTFPTNTGFRDRDWLGLYLDDTTGWGRRWWVRFRMRVIFRWRAISVWVGALGLLAALDFGVFLYLIWDPVLSVIYEWLTDLWHLVF